MDVVLNAMGDVDEKWVESHENQLNQLLTKYQQMGGSLQM